MTLSPKTVVTPEDATESMARRSTSPRESTRGYQLLVADGVDAGSTFPVDAATLTLIGKADHCTIRIHDAHVSREHARLEPSDDGLLLRDLDSSNGTLVNGVRVVEAVLHGGEELRFGSTNVQLRLDTSSRPVPPAEAAEFGPVLGASVPMRRLYTICKRLAGTDVPLVIEGETGTGKEVLAEAIHAESERAKGPFVVFDCTAVHGPLIDAALFGHEKGAFTGAVSSRPGVFEEANGGTLLIDEIGDLDRSLQAKLLRAIQKSEVRRLGGDRWLRVNVRVIGATRRNLAAEVQAGRFRDDLFFRMAVARIVVPALRDRREDIDLLAQHFWGACGGAPSGLPASYLELFRSHSWPGNVRELANTVARVVALGELADSQAVLMVEQAATEAPHDFLAEVISKNLPLAEARERVLREFERRYVQNVMAAHAGDVRRASAASGIGERYLRVIRARSG